MPFSYSMLNIRSFHVIKLELSKFDIEISSIPIKKRHARFEEVSYITGDLRFLAFSRRLYETRLSSEYTVS